jgi:GT2 family glycosyltransferase
MTDTATLMMVTYNRLDLTKRALNNIFANTEREYNLVVVDNGSEDRTTNYLYDMVERHKKLPIGSLKIMGVLGNEENKGIAVGRNQALKQAVAMETDWFCTIDNDVEVPEGWLGECIDIMKANRAYAAIGVNMENKPYSSVTLNGKTFQSKPQGNLGTACMVFPKTVQKMLGYFNTEYGLYGEEDADFGMRLRACGFKLGYIQRMGDHFGDGELDTGEYREFKTKKHAENLEQFQKNCALYFNRKKSIFIPYKEA